MMPYQERLLAIEHYLSARKHPAEPQQLFEPIRYFMGLGGKRVRPLFTVLSAELFQQPVEEVLPAAAALELFHNFTLIHDDIMDGAPMRRNLATVHEKWNTNVAILSGDALMIRSFQELEYYDDKKYKSLNQLLQKTALEVCMGQQLDMDFETKEAVSEDEYLEMIRLKTSVLLGCACAFGGIIGDTTKENVEHLYGFGEQLGIAFQIQDDILDAFGETAAVGKQIGGDILSDKKTILYTAFQSRASALQKEQFSAYLSAEGQEKIEGIKGLFVAADVVTYCKEIQEKHIFSSKAHLEAVSTNANKAALSDLLEFIIHRNH